MKVKVIRDFYDRQINLQLRKAGEEFEADEARATELANGGFVEMIPAEPKKRGRKPKEA